MVAGSSAIVAFELDCAFSAVALGELSSFFPLVSCVCGCSMAAVLLLSTLF